MKFSIILSIVTAVAALPNPNGKRACVSTTDENGKVTKRCNIPWTKNYGEYDEQVKRACVSTTDENGQVTKRCNIPWTKNYGEYDEASKI